MKTSVHNPNPEVKGIRNSYDMYARQISTPAGVKHQIAYGDRIFVRLMQQGRIIMEWCVETVKDLTDLFSALHNRCRQVKGLVRMYLRNVSRGWSEVRPYMFYNKGEKTAKPEEPQVHEIDSRMISAASHPLAPRNLRERYFRTGVEQMAFPWDL